MAGHSMRVVFAVLFVVSVTGHFYYAAKPPLCTTCRDSAAKAKQLRRELDEISEQMQLVREAHNRWRELANSSKDEAQQWRDRATYWRIVAQ